jgi:hypothetical protein
MASVGIKPKEFPMVSKTRPMIYKGDGDRLMQDDVPDRIVLVPDAYPGRTPGNESHIRIMWGQHLLDDLVRGRYRSLVCAVNAADNSHGIISQLAECTRASQWDAQSITAYAQHIQRSGHPAKVLKYDMDAIEVLAVLRPAATLSLADLSAAMRIIVEMLDRKPARWPSASVSFLEARANHLVDESGGEPCFETVLATMYEAGYRGDVYPSPGLWHAAPTAVFARYPFAGALDRRRNGGY